MPLSVLDFEGADYLSAPEKRCFYGAYMPQYEMYGMEMNLGVFVEGSPIEDEVPEDYSYNEVTEGFYESPLGKRWLNRIESWDAIRYTFPVTGTNDLNLIMAFYNGNAYVSSGREFTKEEYERGDRVCIVSDFFAEKNGLDIGDELTLSFRYADYRRTPGSSFGTNFVSYVTFVNAKGEFYPAFEEGNYKIIGLYGGKIDEYMEKWSRQGISNVEITFYDRGYTELEASINNMKYIARLLIVMGVILVLLVLAYFSWLFILKQGERIATERSLGLRKGQCFLSLFSGIFLIILLGSVCGCIAGSCLSGRIAEGIENKTYYDTTFGNSTALEGENALETEPVEQAYPLQSAMQCMLAIIAAGSGIAAVGIRRNLRSEPMKMFAEIRRG